MAELFGEVFGCWADEIEIVEAAPGRRNFIARMHGRDRTRCYAFEAHSDTVGIDGMTIDPFGATIADGRLYGRGACDTKGPMTAMILALLRHLKRGGTPACDLLFLSTCDEELGGLGARRMVEDGFRCDGIIVGEPTSLRLIDCHKGAARFRLTVKGRAAHSAYPEFGANAIHAAAACVREVESAVAILAGTESWPEPGPPTVNVGVIRGGDQVNRVPDRAVLEIDFRVPPQLGISTPSQVIAGTADSVSHAIPGIRIEIEATQNYPAFKLCPESPFRNRLSLLAAAYGIGTARYATNAGFFGSAGIPCVVFGPGSPGDAHTADESIALAEVEEAATKLEEFLETL